MLFVAPAMMALLPLAQEPARWGAKGAHLAPDDDDNDRDRDRARRAAPDPDDADDEDEEEEERRAPVTEITVQAQRLDAARARIEPSLGAASYTLTNDTVENRPGGETRNVGSVLAQTPGVFRDARGALIVRGASGGLEYRLNNVILPAGAGEFGEALSARLADRIELVTGALPAQYGLAPAGVVNITTKNGHYFADGGQAELYGGAHRTIEPAFELSQASGRTSLFLSGSVQRSAIGLPAPDRRTRPLHDKRRELEGFGFLDRLVGDDGRVSLIAGSVNERRQIPGLPVAGVPGAEARFGTIADHNHYGVAAYQLSRDALNLQGSAFALASRQAIRPDEALRLRVDARSVTQRLRRRLFGVQLEGAYDIGSANVVRAGIVASRDRINRKARTVTPTQVRPRETTVHRTILSPFLQDEWTLSKGLTLNAGVRGDDIGATDAGLQVEPRASLTWAPTPDLAVHAGYARSVVASSLEEVAAELVPIRRLEKDNLYDVGAQQKLGRLTLGIDAYQRDARDYLAPRYRNFAPIEEAFSFARARIRGVDLLATFAEGPVTAWSNVTFGRATGKGISGGASELTAPEVAYVNAHRVRLASDQRVSGSAGASWRLGKLLVAGDVLVGSGTPRTAPGGAIDGARLPSYATGDVDVVYHTEVFPGRPADLRLDVRNVTNRRVALSDATSIAGGVTGYNEPRGVYVGIEQSF